MPPRRTWRGTSTPAVWRSPSPCRRTASWCATPPAGAGPWRRSPPASRPTAATSRSARRSTAASGGSGTSGSTSRWRGPRRRSCGRIPESSCSGPPVIDFEYHVTAAVLNLKRAGFRFDAVSALLYVDRRGAPENRQAGLDTVAKVLLLKAIAETARNAAGRCWITEVNWPLREGPHSPAGRDVSVDEETQADYLVRYYLLALGTGLVERVFWWQVVARGYGLVDPADPASPKAGFLRLEDPGEGAGRHPSRSRPPRADPCPALPFPPSGRLRGRRRLERHGQARPGHASAAGRDRHGQGWSGAAGAFWPGD